VSANMYLTFTCDLSDAKELIFVQEALLQKWQSTTFSCKQPARAEAVQESTKSHQICQVQPAKIWPQPDLSGFTRNDQMSKLQIKSCVNVRTKNCSS